MLLSCLFLSVRTLKRGMAFKFSFLPETTDATLQNNPKDSGRPAALQQESHSTVVSTLV